MAGACLALAALAHAQEGAIGRIPVRVLEGRLVARLDLSTPVRRIPVHFFLDYETAYGLEVHARALAPLKIEDGHALTLHFPGLAITRDTWALGHPQMYERFTRLYAKELNETAVVGSLGTELLKRFHLVFDVGAGYLEISAPRAAGAPAPETPAGAVTVPVDVSNEIVWLPVRYGGDRSGVMGLGTTTYDTRVGKDVCRQLKKPAGDIGAVECATVDFAKLVALRPAQLVEEHADGVMGMTGINLLERFRVEVDRVNRRATFLPTRAAAFPQADLDCFRAMASGEPARLEKWLEKHPEERLAAETADLLLRRLFEGGEHEEKRMYAALGWVNRTRPKDLRTSNALDVMKRLEEYGQRKYVVRAGELGLKTGREDRDPTAIHKIHAILGEIHLQEDHREKAWKHLLSAAFGLAEIGPNARPDQGREDAARVHLNLARFYERQKRYARAFSRYVQAVTYPETGTEALPGLLRVANRVEDADRMSYELVERLVAGKAPAHGTADRFEPSDEQPAKRCVLVEMFTGANVGAAIAADLGLDAVQDYFAREHLAVVRYHPALAGLTPISTKLSDDLVRGYGVGRVPLAIFDGTVRQPCGGAERFKERNYEALRQRALDRLKVPTDYEMTGNIAVKDGKVYGSIRVAGPMWDAQVHVLLVEKGVVFPGTNRIVVHHMVARAALVEGARFAPVDGAMLLPFEADLKKIHADAGAYLESVKKRGGGMVGMQVPPIDPAHVSVVAFLRERGTGRTLQACQIEPERKEEG